jgi:hypothetical protein
MTRLLLSELVGPERNSPARRSCPARQLRIRGSGTLAGSAVASAYLTDSVEVELSADDLVGAGELPTSERCGSRGRHGAGGLARWSTGCLAMRFSNRGSAPRGEGPQGVARRPLPVRSKSGALPSRLGSAVSRIAHRVTAMAGDGSRPQVFVVTPVQ